MGSPLSFCNHHETHKFPLLSLIAPTFPLSQISDAYRIIRQPQLLWRKLLIWKLEANALERVLLIGWRVWLFLDERLEWIVSCAERGHAEGAWRACGEGTNDLGSVRRLEGIDFLFAKIDTKSSAGGCLRIHGAEYVGMNWGRRWSTKQSNRRTVR